LLEKINILREEVLNDAINEIEFLIDMTMNDYCLVLINKKMNVNLTKIRKNKSSEKSVL
jgi:hypothetical protein